MDTAINRRKLSSHKFQYHYYGQAPDSNSVNIYLKTSLSVEEAISKMEKDKLNLLENDYVFVHDDPKRNYIIKEEYLKNKKIIRPILGLTDNIFDYLTIIEKAEEIHCMDSSFRMMIDSYPMDKKLYFHTYCRSDSDLAQSKNKWINI